MVERTLREIKGVPSEVEQTAEASGEEVLVATFVESRICRAPVTPEWVDEGGKAGLFM